MDRSPPDETRLRAMREPMADAPGDDTLWRKAGLISGAVIAAMIAYGMLIPVVTVLPASTGLDKIAHFLVFALLIFPVIVTDTRRWFWAVPLAVAYGGGIELVQPYVGRSAEWLDWGADISGVLAGAALAEMLHDRLRGKLVVAPAAQPAPAPSETDRAELIEDLRAVLREELAAIHRPGDLPREDPDEPRATPRH